MAQISCRTRLVRLLPVHHFLVTFTLPDQIGWELRGSQCGGYAALLDAGAESMVDVGSATKSLRGCRLGFFGVLPGTDRRQADLVVAGPCGSSKFPSSPGACYRTTPSPTWTADRRHENPYTPNDRNVISKAPAGGLRPPQQLGQNQPASSSASE